MKTVMIWDQCGTEPLKFAILDGDYQHLDGVYINGSSADPAKEEELTNSMYKEDGTTIVDLLAIFPVEAVRAGAIVIVAGFIP